MRFLVTGGAGFIGSNIVEELLKRGYWVRVLDNFSTGKRENLREFEKEIEIIEGDIRSYHQVQRAVNGMDVILHQAALPSVPRSIHDPITTNEVNVGGTLNVLEAAREAGVSRIVFASSSSVYGNSPELPKHEEMIPNPRSPYAVSKLAGEKYASVYASIYNVHTVSLRYFNVFGPRQDPYSQYSAVIPLFIKAIMKRNVPTIFGDGEQSRDFTYIANVVEANILAATSECEPGTVVNCAGHHRITLNELVAKINSYLKVDIKPHYAASRPGDVKHSFADLQKIQSMLGFRPIVDFDEGLVRTMDWFSSRL